MATTDAPSAPEHDLHRAMRSAMLRAFFGVTAVVGLLGIVAGLASGGQLPPTTRGLMFAGYGMLTAGCIAAMRLAPARTAGVIGPVLLGGMVLVTAVAWATGWGLQTSGLVFFSLAVFFANTMGSARLGLTSVVLALLSLLLLGGGERAGWLPTPVGVPPLASRLVVFSAAIISGAAMGRTVARLLHQHLQAAGEREQRFRALLGIATDAYWETDAELRLSQVSRRDSAGRFNPEPALLGQAPWQIAGLEFDDDNLDLMLAEMQSRAKLRDLPFCWRHPDGGLRHLLASGEPRLDTRGRLLGYWGVVRDVTAEHQARLKQAASDTRYHDLFNQTPTPLVLHQQGIIRDANPAAARLLGYDAVAPMLGQDLLARHLVDAERALAAARIQQIELLPLGQMLPAVELNLRTCSGRLVSVRSTGASSEHAGRPAVLSITLDETEQRAASLALARSQALLASVVSLSPDIITLTELQTGRYVMVNDSFCRLLGYDRAEVVGRTSADIGLWHHLADRERVVQTIAAQDMVQDELIHFVTRSGRLLPLLVSCARVENEGKPYLLLNARDMSEANRVRLEREAILANASVGIAFTRNRHFVLANAQFEQMYGWPAGALTGQPGQAVFIDAADYEALGRDISPALQRGDVADIERQAHRRDGSPFLVRLRAKAIDPTNPTENGTIWITEDVTGARQAEQDLARARDAAEAANRAKSAFLANTSHEIRTPLHGVLGLARLARQPGLAPERQRQMLDQISESAELLAVIISDILDVAKVEAGKLQLESAPFNLHGLLDSLRHDFSALAAGHGLVFDAGFDPALPVWVRGDALRVRQIVANFLHNALKFTASGGIRLQAIALPDERVRFEVHDTGPGIPPATQARLFEPFTQADTSTTRRYGGTGLGLSISRELATLMGGSVGLSSTTGRGSCFHAELPLPAVQAGADTETASAADSLRLRGARVLLVEDNSVNMMIGVALLEQWGVAVTEAVDGRQALEAIAQASAAGRRFDAVLMDVQMPGMSGYEATQILRQHHGADQLPVIALTAAALVSERTHALAIGMNDFLTKPIDPTRLQAALLRALADPAPATPGPAA